MATWVSDRTRHSSSPKSGRDLTTHRAAINETVGVSRHTDRFLVLGRLRGRPHAFLYQQAVVNNTEIVMHPIMPHGPYPEQKANPIIRVGKATPR